MALGRLHIVVGVADDVGVGQPGGALGAGGVLAAAEPDRVAGRRHDDGLVDVERPAVVAGQPVHVRRVADDQELDALRLHRGAGAGEAVGVLGGGEAGLGLGTGFLGVRPGAGVLQHAGEAHRDMGAADVPDRVPVADLGGGEHLLHLAAEGAELGGEAELGHHLQDDAGDLDVEPLADLAQRPVRGHRVDLLHEGHVEAQEGAGVAARRSASHSAIMSRMRSRSAGVSGDRVELAEEGGELHAQAVDLGELLDVDVGDDGADAVHRADQALGLEPGQHPADRRAADRELLGELLLGEPGAGRVVEQADAVAERLVDALGASAGRKPSAAGARSSAVIPPPSPRSGTGGCARSSGCRRARRAGPARRSCRRRRSRRGRRTPWRSPSGG